MEVCYLCKQIIGVMGREDNNRDLLEFDAPIVDQMQNIIKVIGVGGGGCNAVRNMYNEECRVCLLLYVILIVPR